MRITVLWIRETTKSPLFFFCKEIDIYMHKPRAKRGSQLYRQLFIHPRVIDLSESKMEEREFRLLC